MISTQVAISFENATLYKNLQNVNRMLETKNKSLIDMDQVKDQFLANTSHELRYFPPPVSSQTNAIIKE